MTTQFIQIGRNIINLQTITNVVYIPPIEGNKAYAIIHFNREDNNVLLEDKEATTFWHSLQKSSLNLTPKSPELPKLEPVK